MPPILEIKKKTNTIKQHGEGDNVHQRPLDIKQLFENTYSRNYINLITFFTSTYITAQSRCRLRRVRMPKKMAS